MSEASVSVNLDELERLARAAEGATVAGASSRALYHLRALELVLTPSVVLELIRMARTGYSRALRDVAEGMEVAKAEGVPVLCPYGCASKGWPVQPGCPIHDPTAPLLETK